MIVPEGLASRSVFLLDASLVAIISVLICLASNKLLLMTIAIPSLLLLRNLIAIHISKKENRKAFPEIIFYVICTLLGAFNDWNSVVNKGIYAYHVPHEFAFSTIPFWMLLYWGLILRFMAGLAWRISDGRVSNKTGLGKWHLESGLIKALFGTALLLITRQFIYRFYLDPLWSWLPFLFALFLFLLTTYPSKKDLLLALVFLTGGPAIEMLYINAGGLHAYHLGWMGGVPLWIILWWMLAVLIWKDVSARIYRMLSSVL